MVTTKADVKKAFEELGVTQGDLVLVHSSYKSLGPLEKGPDTVVEGIEAAIGPEGTLVMPTLCQKDWLNTHKSWHMDKPSDVGYLTEYFRKLPGVLRSDHPTHSVAARGKYAYELTFEHAARGPHLCPFGDTAFSDSSPWMKMYHMGTKTVFIGVAQNSNTAKHTVECRYAEDLLAAVRDDGVREELRSQVPTFGHYDGSQAWPLFKGIIMQEEFERLGLVTHGKCGDAPLMMIDMKQTCDAAYEIICANPENWFNEATLEWIARCRAAAV